MGIVPRFFRVPWHYGRARSSRLHKGRKYNPLWFTQCPGHSFSPNAACHTGTCKYFESPTGQRLLGIPASTEAPLLEGIELPDILPRPPGPTFYHPMPLLPPFHMKSKQKFTNPDYRIGMPRINWYPKTFTGRTRQRIIYPDEDLPWLDSDPPSYHSYGTYQSAVTNVPTMADARAKGPRPNIGESPTTLVGDTFTTFPSPTGTTTPNNPNSPNDLPQQPFGWGIPANPRWAGSTNFGSGWFTAPSYDWDPNSWYGQFWGHNKFHQP